MLFGQRDVMFYIVLHFEVLSIRAWYRHFSESTLVVTLCWEETTVQVVTRPRDIDIEVIS